MCEFKRMIRKQILLEPHHNQRLKALRSDTGMSESEIMRRALDAFDPSGAPRAAPSREVSADLVGALARQNHRTSEALHCAARELDRTLRGLARFEAPAPVEGDL